MATKIDLRKTLTDATPVYAAVGFADTVYTTVRDRAVDVYAEGNKRVLALGEELRPSAVQARVTKGFADVREAVEAAPSVATKRLEEAGNEAAGRYDAYARRGERVVAEMRDDVEAFEKRAQKQATDAQARVLSTVAAGRKNAAKVVADGAAAVEEEARTEVRSAAAKEGAAKRPARKTVAKRATASKKPAAKKPAAKKPASKKATTTRRTAVKKAPATKTAQKASATPKAAETKATSSN